MRSNDSWKGPNSSVGWGGDGNGGYDSASGSEQGNSADADGGNGGSGFDNDGGQG